MKRKKNKWHKHTIFLDEKKCVFNACPNRQNNITCIEPKFSDKIEYFETVKHPTTLHAFWSNTLEWKKQIEILH